MFVATVVLTDWLTCAVTEGLPVPAQVVTVAGEFNAEGTCVCVWTAELLVTAGIVAH